MKRKPDLAKAAALAAVAKKNGGVFVFATRDANLPSVDNVSAEIAQYPFAEVQCASCGSQFHAPEVAGMQHHCVTCGHGECKVVKASSEPTIASDEKLTYLTCAKCSTHNLFDIAVASIGDHVHCVVCAEAMLTKADVMVDMPGETIVDTTPVDVDDMELLDLGDEIEESTTTNEDETGVPANPKPLTEDPVAPLDKDVNTQVPLTEPVKMATSDADELPDNDPQSVDMDMMDVLDDDAALSFVYTADKVSLVSEDRVIATLTEATAGEHAGTLQTEEFRNAVAHSVATLGLKKTVAQYKMKPVTIKVPVAKVIAKQVAAKVEAETASLSAKGDSYAEDFQQALEIAAAGYAGNFWRNKQDPLKASLVSELSAAGHKNPQRLVDRVMAAHAIPQLREIVALARELAKKPVEARNGLAEAIDLAKYQPMVTAAEDDTDEDTDDEDEEEDEEDVATVATPVVATAHLNGSSPYKTGALQSILGDGPLFG